MYYAHEDTVNCKSGPFSQTLDLISESLEHESGWYNAANRTDGLIRSLITGRRLEAVLVRAGRDLEPRSRGRSVNSELSPHQLSSPPSRDPDPMGTRLRLER